MLARIAEVIGSRFRVGYTLGRVDLLLHRIGRSVQGPRAAGTASAVPAHAARPAARPPGTSVTVGPEYPSTWPVRPLHRGTEPARRPSAPGPRSSRPGLSHPR
jgi:hypothetical protein